MWFGWWLLFVLDGRCLSRNECLCKSTGPSCSFAEPNKMIEPDLGIAEKQRSVQRMLGRCLLRLQQYERMLKALLSNSSLSGTLKTIEDARDKKAKVLGKTTLGNLVGEFVRDFLIKDNSSVSHPPDESGALLANGSDMHVLFKFGMSMSDHDHETLRVSLQELVDLRNLLVHHLIEDYDVWTVSGCVGASDFLEVSYQRIDAETHRLRSWCKSLAETRQIAADLFASPVFENMLVHGIQPDGTVMWTMASIVECLREAEKLRGADGWTRLDDAIFLIGREHPDQKPSKYGCESWRQVLHELQLFKVMRRPESGTAKSTWYRSVEIT